jgi:putative FmdB family regulatory protein
MPIYEFYCSHCHRIFSFLARRIDTTSTPDCPKCGHARLPRKPSAFAISKNRPEAEASGPQMPDMDEEKLAQALESLGPEAENLNEDDPRQAAQLMRKVFAATGMPVNGGWEEALKRMESGEDPEKIENEMGDLFEQDPWSGEGGAAGKLASTLRRKMPPSVDSTLYEL